MDSALPTTLQNRMAERFAAERTTLQVDSHPLVATCTTKIAPKQQPAGILEKPKCIVKRTCAGQKKTDLDILRHFKTDDKPYSSSERETEPKTVADAPR
jgi:hypothetical protein